MITLYRIDHVSQVVADLSEQARLLETLFGFRPIRRWESAEERCRGMMFELRGSRSQRWELLEPTDASSPLQSFLDSPRGPGLHHIGVETNDMDAALAELDRMGIGKHARRSEGGEWVDVAISPPASPPKEGSNAGPDGLLLRLFAAPSAAVCGDDRGFLPSGDTGSSDGPAVEVQDDVREGIGIRELVHVCQATADLDAFAAWNERLLGMGAIYRTPEGKHPDMATMMLSLPGTQIIWELIAPVGEESFVERFIEKRGEGACHHVTFEVEDWDRAVGACEQNGIPIFGETTGETDGAKWRDAFIHPKYTAGVLVQIYFEERPGVWMRSDKIPVARKAVWT